VGWLIGRRLFFLELGGQHGVGEFDVELVRVELFADPVDPFGVLGMGGIGQDGQQFLIAPDASAIFWRTVALSGDTDRIGLSLDRRLAFFEGDRVFPSVAEVISVGEANDGRSQQAVQGRAIFVGDVVDAASIAKLLALYAEALIGWNTKVRGFTKRGGCVVIERGWWDLAVDPVRYRLRPHPKLVRALGRMLPQSDLLIVLEGTIELLMSRTSESTEQEIADQTNAWRHRVPVWVPRVYLDVSSPVEELVGRAADELARVLPPDTLRSR